jgi:hypothetical protein
MYRKIPQEAGRKEGHRRRVKEIRQIDARGGSDGGAQILKLTHAVDNKVTGVGNKLKEVDDKMDVVIKGKPGLLATY